MVVEAQVCVKMAIPPSGLQHIELCIVKHPVALAGTPGGAAVGQVGGDRKICIFPGYEAQRNNRFCHFLAVLLHGSRCPADRGAQKSV